MKRQLKRNFSFAIGIVLSGVLLYFAFLKVEISTVINSIVAANPLFLAFAVVSFFCGFFVRAYLWKVLLNLNSQTDVPQLFKSIIIGYMGNIVLPLRGGELLRVISLKKMCKISMSKSLSSIIVERVLDLISLIILTGVLSLFMAIPGIFKPAINLIIVLSLSCLATLIYFANTPFLYKYIYWLIRFFPQKYKAKGDAVLHNFVIGLSALNSQWTILKIIVLSLICWSLVYCSLFFALNACHLNPNWIMTLALLVIISIASTIPILPAYIGIYPFFTILALGLFGVEKSVALGFSFVLQAIDFIPPIILGVFFFFQENLLIHFQKKEPHGQSAIS